MADQSRLHTRSSSAAPPPPPPPPAPPPQQGQRYTNRATSALARFAQPFLSGSRPPSPYNTSRDEPSPSTRPARAKSLPGLSQTITHKTGLPITSLDISPQKTHAVIAGREILKTIRVSADGCSEEFDLRNAIVNSSVNQNSSALSARHKDQLSVKDVKWSHGEYDKIIATAVANGRIVVYDLQRPTLELARFQGHSRQVHKLAFNPHLPAWLLSGSQDATIRMWDVRMASGERGVATCSSKERYNGNSDAVRDIRWSPTDGVMFATATDSGAIQLWDARKVNAPLMKIAAHDKPCFSVDWHPDGKHLVSGGTDKQVKVWDFSSSAERRQKPTFQFRTPQAVVNVRWRPPYWTSESQGPGDWQSTQLVTSYDKEDPRVHLWDLRRPHIPFREFDRYGTSAADLLWRSKDLLWTVGEGGVFTQTDIRYAPQVVSQRPMCSVGWSPSGEVLTFAQKRPRRRPLGIDTAEFLDPGEEHSSSGEKLTSQSLTDDSLDEAIVTAPIRKRHGRAAGKRGSKSVSHTPPTADDSPELLSLEKSLSRSKAVEPCQIGVFGRVPGVTVNPELFRYLAEHYSPLIEDPDDGQTHDNALEVLLKAFDHNAEQAESASMLKLAQTWRMVKYAVVQELQVRAQKQEEIREQKNKNAHKRQSADVAIADRTRKPEEGRADKLKSRLFKGVLETEGHMGVVPDAESTSNMTTPLAQPLPDSPPGNQTNPGQLEDEYVDFQPLPPSVINSHYGTMASNELAISDLDTQSGTQLESQTSEDVQMSASSVTASQLRDAALQEMNSDQRSAPRAIAGRADWHLQGSEEYGKGASEEDYDQKIEDKRAAIRDYKIAPKKLLTYEPPAGDFIKVTQPGHGSADSFPMFSASTDSSHRAKSMGGASFSPQLRPRQTESGGWDTEDAEEQSVQEQKDEAGNGSVVDYSSEQDKDGLPPNMSFDESVSDTDRVHLERPSSPPALRVESGGVNGYERDTFVQSTSSTTAARTATISSAPRGAHDLDLLSIPMSPELTGTKPWSAQAILRETIRYYHSSTPVDVQSAAHLLHKMHLLFYACEKILPYEECELVLKTYNEHLLRQSMYVEAAELRLMCVPTYPAVYDYAQSDTFINVYCYTCKKPYENPKRDNRRCYRCQTPQEPCSICMSVDPPPEWTVPESQKLATGLKNEDDEPAVSSFASVTEAIPASEFEQLDQVVSDSYTPPRPFGSSLWTWCQGCGHGGHLACMTTWLKDVSISEGGCATPGCLHDCGPGPRREENRAQLLEESKRHPSGRKGNVSFAKHDSWTTSESKAVQNVRSMLGATASTSGASALTGSASTGVMSPKKVRLVTPREQGKRRSGTAGSGSSAFGSKDREGSSDLLSPVSES
ncbi:SEA (Seh1-associated) complex subunit [Paecilomyces lecythidis]